MSWLSNKQWGKAYGSMVIYVTKENDARRLMAGHYFDLAGESATTNVFERRTGVVQCYNSQAIGHKSFQCKNSQLCGRCAMPGHQQKECQEAEPRSIAFIDDYSAWVTGPTVEANRAGIQSTIDEALDWEKRSGATFEADKTTVVHFTRASARSSDVPFWSKGKEVKPKASAKILRVIMDSGLRYQKHMASAAAKGLTAVMALRRLKLLSPRVARQLFMATVAPAMDYASNVWTHARRAKETGWLNKTPRVGAQAITGSFQTVATAVAEAEASIHAVWERHKRAATRLCVDLRTLPQTHPLAALRNKASKRYLSPMQSIATMVAKVSAERMEVIHEYALRPWTDRIHVLGEDDFARTVQTPNDIQGIIIATASSQRNGRIGMGGVVCDTTRDDTGHILATCSVAAGPRSEQNLYTGELGAIATALRSIPPSITLQDITIAASNRW
ncbi:zinc knuckle [Verticillium dahliae]